jgi:hypothetical protein
MVSKNLGDLGWKKGETRHFHLIFEVRVYPPPLPEPKHLFGRFFHFLRFHPRKMGNNRSRNDAVFSASW